MRIRIEKFSSRPTSTTLQSIDIELKIFKKQLNLIFQKSLHHKFLILNSVLVS
ncbi:MAG TPA: hypothetical protein GXZ48_03235 [Acholeplasmataceae bacterium]|nr:hypothetical protein [Acholeplasmataceae bacterium]